jgi:hypothetical protein
MIKVIVCFVAGILQSTKDELLRSIPGVVSTNLLQIQEGAPRLEESDIEIIVGTASKPRNGRAVHIAVLPVLLPERFECYSQSYCFEKCQTALKYLIMAESARVTRVITSHILVASPEEAREFFEERETRKANYEGKSRVLFWTLASAVLLAGVALLCLWPRQILVGILAIMLLNHFMKWMYAVPTYVREDVITVLNHIEWKSSTTLRMQLGELKNVDYDQDLRRLWWSQLPSIGWVISTLDQLMEDGLVENRTGTDSSVIEKRGFRPYYEYRLTLTGSGKRQELMEQESIASNLREALP